MLSQDHAGVGEHDDAEVEADGPEGYDDAEAVHAFGVEDRVGKFGRAATGAGGRGGWGGYDAVSGCGAGCDIDAADVVFRVGEAGGVVDGSCARAFVTGILAGVVLGQDEEPGYAKGGGVSSVDDAVYCVEPC